MILPVPGWRRTRATEVFRPPMPVVPGVRCARGDLIMLLAHLFSDLALVRMLRTCVDPQFAVHRPAQRVLWKHPANGVLDDALRVAVHHLSKAHGPQGPQIP